MDLRKVWEDDLLSFIAFLVVILPLPFVYVALQNVLNESNHVVLGYYTFLGVAVMWLAVGILYTVVFVKGDEVEDAEVQEF